MSVGQVIVNHYGDQSNITLLSTQGDGLERPDRKSRRHPHPLLKVL